MSDDAPIALVQEADCSERVVVLKIRTPGRTAFVILGATRRAGGGAGLLPAGARQELWAGRLPPGAARQRGREDALAKARIVSIGEDEVHFEPWAARKERELATDDVNAQTEAGANVAQKPTLIRCLRVHGGKIVITALSAPNNENEAPGFLEALELARAPLEERGRAIAQALAEDAIDLSRDDLVRALEKALQKIARRRGAILQDLEKIAQADRLASQAQWLIHEATRAPRGATKLVVTDWSSGEGVLTEVALDPSKSARDQVDAMFTRAKRLKLGGHIARERLAQAEGHARAVDEALARVREATSLAAMEIAAREAKTQAPRDVALPGAVARAGTDAHPGACARAAAGARGGPRGASGAFSPRVPFRTFVGRTGRKILVGKGAADNDTLTLKIAKPHDLWLHAKDRTGAHVVVPLDKRQTCPAEDLVDAAHLAAHFSDARDEMIVDVQYTPKRYLRKPKGSAAGAIVVDREKVMTLRVDTATLRGLLEREET